MKDKNGKTVRLANLKINYVHQVEPCLILTTYSTAEDGLSGETKKYESIIDTESADKLLKYLIELIEDKGGEEDG